MKKYAGIILVGVLSITIGIVLAAQMSSTGGSDQGGLVPYSKLKSYEVELTQVRTEKDAALKSLTELQDRLAQIEKEMAAENAVIEGLVTDTEKYRLITGVTDVQGPGIIITIKDPVIIDEYQDDISVITYHYEELLSLVNKLKEAGAEAISINEHRIIQTTEISLAGQNININGNATAPPYYIKAIGNPDTMKNALTIRNGIIESMKKNLNLTVEIQAMEMLMIPRYTGVIDFEYAQTIAGEEVVIDSEEDSESDEE